MNAKIAILFFLLSSYFIYAECSEGSAKFFIPAVIGGGTPEGQAGKDVGGSWPEGGRNGGEISQFSVQIKNGSGNIYTSINPKVDESTQISQEIASFVGFRHANKSQEECDVFFGISERAGLASVNGLSGGAGMALGVIGALQNRSIRQDLAITGTIEPDGSIGSVGGLFEKAQAAKASNLTYLIVPKRDFFDSLFWSALNTSVKMVEAGDILEAAGVAFSRGKINSSESRLEAERVGKNISKNTIGANAAGIRELAKGMREKLEAGLSGKKFGGEIGNYFGIRKENSDSLFDKGYYYSAANEAFLAGIDLEFISGVEGHVDAKKEMEGIRDCAEGLKTQDLRPKTNNWELAVGGRLRESWAKKKISEVMDESPATVEEQNYFYRESLYAKGWCGIAGKMQEMAVLSGNENGNDEIERKINNWLGEKEKGQVDEAIFREMARSMLDEAKKASTERMIESSDAEWRAENAEALYEKGSYLASIFDSIYAYSMQDARGQVVGKDKRDVQEIVEGMLSQEYSGMWAGAYAGHAKYLYEEDRDGNVMQAYYTLKFAWELEKAAREINARIAGEGKEEGKQKEAGAAGINLSFDPIAAGMFLALAFSIGALIYAIFLILKKKD